MISIKGLKENNLKTMNNNELFLRKEIDRPLTQKICFKNAKLIEKTV